MINNKNAHNIKEFKNSLYHRILTKNHVNQISL